MENQTIFQKISPNIKGIIWLTKGKLSHSSWCFHEINYLTNGQFSNLITFLKDKPSRELGLRLVESVQFDQPFFVGQIVFESEKETLKKASQILDLKINSLEHNASVMVVNETSFHLVNKLKQKYTNLELKSYRKEDLETTT